MCIRPILAGIPVGVRGVVKSVERPKNDFEASADYFKGRIVEVEFDCSHLPFPEEMAAILRRNPRFEIPPFWGKVTTRVQPQDIRPIVPEVNPENVSKAVEDIWALKDCGKFVRALKTARKWNRVVATIGTTKTPYGVEPAVAITLFRAGIFDYVGIEAGGDVFRLTEFGYHVAHAIDDTMPR